MIKQLVNHVPMGRKQLAVEHTGRSGGTLVQMLERLDSYNVRKVSTINEYLKRPAFSIPAQQCNLFK